MWRQAALTAIICRSDPTRIRPIPEPAREHTRVNQSCGGRRRAGRQRRRSTEVMSLAVVDAILLEYRSGLFVSDMLGDHGSVEAVGNVDDPFDDHSVIAATGQSGDQAVIYLDELDGNAFELRERSEA
jgi:hypothetical protein